MGAIFDMLKGMPINAVLREKLDVLEKKYEALEFENEKIKQENQALKDSLAAFENEDATSTDLNGDMVKILQHIASSEQPLAAETIAVQLHLKPTTVEYYLQLDSMKYARPATITSGSLRYHLTQEGRRYLVENGLLD